MIEGNVREIYLNKRNQGRTLYFLFIKNLNSYRNYTDIFLQKENTENIIYCSLVAGKLWILKPGNLARKSSWFVEESEGFVKS